MKKIILIRFGVFFKILIEESFSFWNDFFEYCATDNFLNLYDLNIKKKKKYLESKFRKIFSAKWNLEIENFQLF